MTQNIGSNYHFTIMGMTYANIGRQAIKRQKTSRFTNESPKNPENAWDFKLTRNDLDYAFSDQEKDLFNRLSFHKNI